MNPEARTIPSGQRRCSGALITLDIAFMTSLLTAPVVWLFSALKVDILDVVKISIHWGWKPILMPALLLVARAFIAHREEMKGFKSPQGLLGILPIKRLVLAIVAVCGVVAVVESTLTALDFKASLPPPMLLVDKNPEGVVQTEDAVINDDPELIYRLRPGSRFHGGTVNNIGFLAPDVEVRKPAGTVRVICMGDSVTAQGRPGYTKYLDERLSNDPPTPAKWEVINMGLFGYSSLQGLMLFRKQARDLQPDIVTLYYGWNDHCLADKSDREQIGLSMGPCGARFYNACRNKRTFMFLAWAMNPVLHIARLGEGPDKLDYRGKADVFDGRVLRVPPEAYRRNLETMIDEIRDAGAVPLLITAPRNTLTTEVVDLRYTRAVEEGNALHDEYIAITRDVAAKTDTPLLDLAAILSGPESRALFSRDGIHFDHYANESRMQRDYTQAEQPGLMRVAAEIDRALRQLVRGKEWQARHNHAGAFGVAPREVVE